MHYLKTPVFVIGLLALTACGGGGSSAPTPPANAAPSADSGMDLTVAEFDTVTLDGSASTDPDNDPITYVWTQTAGTTVTIANDDMAQASFDAPDVTAVNTPEILTFQLQVSDGNLMNTAAVTVTVNDVGLGTNTPPTANAGADQTVGELTSVDLDGSASSDADGDSFSYAWLQTAGTTVTLSDATADQPSFMSPDVTAPEILTFQLTVDDGSDSTMDTVDITVQEALSVVTVAGKLQFQMIVARSNCNGLLLNNPESRNMRGVTVQIIAGNTVLGTTFTDNNGDYSFSNIDANQNVKVRVRAELLNGGAATWNVEVRDNTSNTNLPLTQRPIYVLDFPEFNSGTSNISDADFLATSGWDGSSFSGTRAAGPFALLDVVMDTMFMVTNVDPTVAFPPLDIYWSINNVMTSPSNIDAGELSTTFYTNSGLYILGDADTDADEYDVNITAHEWGHYFEDNFSRSDSMGGPHSIGAPLDPRLAFGEGLAYGLAAIALQDPIGCDTRDHNGTNVGGGANWETAQGLQGWFNEYSVGSFIYDLWDTNVDGTDNGSIGFGPIYETMVGPERVTPAFTSIFSFAAGLRPMLNGADLAFVDSQLNRINVDTPAVVSEWGDSQTTAPTNGTFPLGRDIVPYFTELQVGAAPVNVCLNNDYFPNYEDGDGVNKLGMFRHFRFTTNSTANYTITATANPAPPSTTGPGDPMRDDSDPDLFLNRSMQFFAFDSSTGDGGGQEIWTTTALPANTYILRLQEWRHIDVDRAPGYPSQVCFDVSISL